MLSPEGSLEGELSKWLDAARAGSSEAIGQVLEGCRQYLLLVANEELDTALAVKVAPSDLVQESLLKAHQKFAQFHGRHEADLLGWLRRILLNALADIGRQYHGSDKRALSREVSFGATPGRGLHTVLPVEDGSPSSLAVAREQDELLQRALGRLSRERQQVIRWRNYDRLSFEEIGGRLGRSAEAARKLWTRALRELQTLLEPPHAPDG